jgi:hypothetical protein
VTVSTTHFYCTYTVEPRFTNLIRSWRLFVTRNVRKPKLCVLSENYTATDALSPILPACRQPLLPACLFVTRDTVRHPRLFFFGKFVRDESRSWTEIPLYYYLGDMFRLYYWAIRRSMSYPKPKTGEVLRQMGSHEHIQLKWSDNKI